MTVDTTLVAAMMAYIVVVSWAFWRVQGQVRRIKQVIFVWYVGFYAESNKCLPEHMRKDLEGLKIENVLASILAQTGLTAEFADWLHKRISKIEK